MKNKHNQPMNYRLATSVTAAPVIQIVIQQSHLNGNPSGICDGAARCETSPEAAMPGEQRQLPFTTYCHCTSNTLSQTLVALEVSELIELIASAHTPDVFQRKPALRTCNQCGLDFLVVATQPTTESPNTSAAGGADLAKPQRFDTSKAAQNDEHRDKPFAMHRNWEPTERLATLLKMRMPDVEFKELDEATLIQFINHFIGKPKDKRIHDAWEDRLAQWIDENRMYKARYLPQS